MQAVGRQPPETGTALARLPFYYGWVVLVVAAAAMTATLPGRTHGLGLIEKPLRTEMGMGQVEFSALNFWAVILGAAFCWPVGRLLDRLGTRGVLTAVVAALGAVVMLTSGVEPGAVVTLVILFTLTRGLGQGALSVASTAAVGKWFTRRVVPAMAAYTVLLAIGFIASTVWLGEAVKHEGWRDAWFTLGLVLAAVVAPLCLLLVRNTPESCGIPVEPPDPDSDPESGHDWTLRQALASPAFWVFTLGTSLFGLVFSALTFLNQSLLEERGFTSPVMISGGEVSVYVLVLGLLTASGLLANMAAGWLARSWPLGRLLGFGLATLGITLLTFPTITTVAEVVAYALTVGVAGGFITVVHFAIYPATFGRKNLGQIQGAAQVVSVLASAGGPVILAARKESLDSYAPFFYAAAPLTVVLGLAAWWVPSAAGAAPRGLRRRGARPAAPAPHGDN